MTRATGPSAQPRRPRRAPAPGQRQRDAERSRERLLTAALDEFAARGYAGARVGAIAARAGLNPQLITYYFGGKPGLYEALRQRWLEQEAAITPPGGSLEDLAVAYLRASLDDPRMTRLLLWDGLTAGDHLDRGEREDLSDLHQRQADGGIAADLDPGLFQLALMGAIMAPVAMPQVVRRITGLGPADADFKDAYAEQVRRIVRHLSR